eukprot:187069_1
MSEYILAFVCMSIYNSLPFVRYRRVTKVRNVIERVFGRIKKWEIFRHRFSVQYEPAKIVRMFAILCAMLNHVAPPLYSDSCLKQMESDARVMMGRNNMSND